MASVVDHLKAQARILHRQARAGDARALARIAAAGVHETPVARADCLRAVARELGFQGWPHAASVLRGDRVQDFGTLLYANAGAAHWNIWSASYEEASVIRREHGGFLLPYKRQFFITDSFYIEDLGLDAQDPDWDRIERDWVQPKDVQARNRLYERLIDVRQAARSSAPC